MLLVSIALYVKAPYWKHLFYLQCSLGSLGSSWSVRLGKNKNYITFRSALQSGFFKKNTQFSFPAMFGFLSLWVTSGHRSAKNYKYGHFQHGSSHNTNAEPWKCEIARKNWWIRWLLIVMVFECCSLTLQDQFNSINIIITGPSWQIALIWWKSAFCINLRFVVKPLQ